MQPGVSGRLIDVKGLTLAAFLLVGAFKADPRLQWLPVDPTLLLALAVAGLSFLSLVQSGFRFPRSLGWLLLLFVLFALPLLWMEFHPYATEKVSRLFTLTLVATVAPLFLLQGRDEIYRFFNALTLLSLLLGVDAGLQLMKGGDGLNRLSAFGANPISFGRAIGSLFLWCAVLGIEGRLRGVVAASAVAVAGLLLVASGSRGPLLSALGGLALAGMLYYRRDRRMLLRFSLAALMVTVSVTFALASAPETSGERIERFAQGDLGRSELTRVDAYLQSLDLIAAHPAGVGWGGFASRIDQSGLGGYERQYPHNMLLEAYLEGGWLVGSYLLLLLAWSGSRILRLPRAPENHGLFLFFLYFLMNAMVSGDLNDNRLLFALMAMGFQAGWGADEQTQGGPLYIGSLSG